MAMLTDEQKREQMLEWINFLDAQSPTKGRTVRVTKGRKKKGEVGIVLKQIKDKYDTVYYWKYYNPYIPGIDCKKRDGYVSLVEFPDGTQCWILSHYLEVLHPTV